MDYSSIDDVMGDKHGEESSPNPTTKAFIPADEFKIIQMTIKDAENKGKVLWQVNNWSLDDPESEQCVMFPAEILKCTAISREIVFYSKKKIEKFSIVQRMSMHGHVIEVIEFKFGFVIPNSTNSWDQTIEADVGKVLPAEILSGNLVVDTYFLQGEDVLAHTKYRIFYT